MNAASPNDAALDLVGRLRRGETSAVEAMRLYLRRIEEREKDVRAFAYLAPEAAMAAAEKADAAKASGLALRPLHGLPVAVKDIIDTADMPTEFGGEIFAGRRPKRDATIVERLRLGRRDRRRKGGDVAICALRPRSGPQSPRPRAHARRIVQRFGRRGRGGLRSRSRSGRRPTARSSGPLPIAASSGSSRASVSCRAPACCGTRRSWIIRASSRGRSPMRRWWSTRSAARTPRTRSPVLCRARCSPPLRPRVRRPGSPSPSGLSRPARTMRPAGGFRRLSHKPAHQGGGRDASA